MDLTTAVKIALASMMSTARANLSVGPPYDVGIYKNGSMTYGNGICSPPSPTGPSFRTTTSTG